MIPVLGLLAGVLLGILLKPDVPLWLQPYLPIAVVAALDAVLGALRAAAPVRGYAMHICVTLIAPWLVLLPMSAQWLRQPSLLVMSSGAIAEQQPLPTAVWWQAFSLSNQGWRWWGVVIAALGAAAVLRGASHRFTRDLGIAALVPLLAIVVANHVTFRVAGLVSPTAPDPSIPIVLLAIVAGVSLATAADGLLPALRQRGLGVRHVFAGVSALATLAATCAGLWLAIAGTDSTLARGLKTEDIPAFAAADLETNEWPRVLVMHAHDPAPLGFAVRSARTALLGEDDMLRMQGGDSNLSDAVRTLVAQGEVSGGDRAAALATITQAGIRYLALAPDGAGAASVAQALVRAPGLRQLAAAQDGRGWWLWRVPGNPSRVMFQPLPRANTKNVSSRPRAVAWEFFTGAGRSSPGSMVVASAQSSSAPTCCVVQPGTVRIADATQGWIAVIDGRPEPVVPTGSGTAVVDLPLGARDSLSITRSDRSRTLWLVTQTSVVSVLIFAAFSLRRRDDAQGVTE